MRSERPDKRPSDEEEMMELQLQQEVRWNFRKSKFLKLHQSCSATSLLELAVLFGGFLR